MLLKIFADMHLIVKRLVLIAIVFSWTACAQAQGSVETQQRVNDPCGDPTAESMSWIPVKGVVEKVIDGNTLAIVQNKRRSLVHLVGVDAPSIADPFGPDAQQLLQRIVGGKKVEVWVSPSSVLVHLRPKVITGVVYLPGADLEDANLALIRAGMARHKKSKPYTMSNYTECQYERAEQEARTARRGLWQRAA